MHEATAVDAAPLDRAACLAAAHGAALLADLKASGAAPGHAAFAGSAGGYCVLVIVAPSGPAEGIDGLSQCERDCLALLAQATAPLSAVRVRRELEKRGIGIWGIATVKRALARLRRLGLVSNARRGARGYYLPETSPIVRKAGAA